MQLVQEKRGKKEYRSWLEPKLVQKFLEIRNSVIQHLKASQTTHERDLKQKRVCCCDLRQLLS